jgi:hypothetical protein
LKTLYDYQPGTKSVLVCQGSKGRVILMGIDTLLAMGRGGYLTGKALKDYDAMKDMNCEK